MENIVLIGMPSSGKSTVGRMAAKRLGLGFTDCDRLIERREGKSLSELIGLYGAEGFLKIEEDVCSHISVRHSVIATGGSAVYSEPAMRHLKQIAVVAYLKIDAATMEKRIPHFTSRGVVMRGNVATLKELYAERTPLYECYADFSIDCMGKSPYEVTEILIKTAGAVL